MHTDMLPRVRMRQMSKVYDDKLDYDCCILSPHPDAQTRLQTVLQIPFNSR